MHKKRNLFSVALAIIVLVTTISGFSTTLVSASEGLTLDYLISYSGGANSPPQVTIVIGDLNTTQIDLVISPMNIFTGQDQSLWLVDLQQIVATGEDGKQLPVSDRGIKFEYYLGKAAQYRMLRVNVTGQSKVTIQYKLNRTVLTGFLETLLLRPRDHNLVGNGTLRFELPADWQAVTVLTKEQNAIFPLGSMDSFYGDNQESIYNFVPAGFAVGGQDDILELDTDCGRLIYAYPLFPMQANAEEALLGKATFEYYCRVFGPLVPFNAYLSGMAYTEWRDISGQLGLYPFYSSHLRTVELFQSMPTLVYRSWEWKLCPNTPFFCDLPDYAYYGFPHKLLRAWLSPGGLIFMPSGSDWFFRGGISVYFQEMAMAPAFGEHRVYQRFQDLYQYYQANYVQSGLDQSIFSQPADEMTYHFVTYFKSGLWGFYLNQRILESTQGEKSIADLSRYLYANYAGIGRPLTYEEIKEAVNMVAGTDLGDVWSRYAYGNEPLPLDPYFQDDDQDGLMNGLEAERHTNPGSADSDRDGVDDSVEYAAECEQVALDPIYCTEVIPPDAKGIQPDPSAASRFTYVPLSIKLDGASSDWPEIPPLDTDPQDSGPYDFAALYGFSDKNYLYLRIDPDGLFPSTSTGQFTFDIVAQGESRLVFQASTRTNEPGVVHLVPIVDNVLQSDGQKRYRGSALDQVFELAIPLEYLGYPERVTISSPYVTVADQLTSLDSFGTFGNPAIKLDGISSDWPEIPPLDTDPQDSGPYDFAALYGFFDENYLYLRIDPYGYFSSEVPGQFTFDIVAQGESRLVFQAFTIPNQPEDVHLAPNVDNVLQFNRQKIYKGAALDKVFELVIPLSYLGYPEKVTIHAYVNAADQPTTYDSFDSVEYATKSDQVALAPRNYIVVIPSDAKGLRPTPTATSIITNTPLSIATSTATSTLASTPTNTSPSQPIESSSSYLLRAVLILGAVTVLIGVFLIFRKMRR